MHDKTIIIAIVIAISLIGIAFFITISYNQIQDENIRQQLESERLTNAKNQTAFNAWFLEFKRVLLMILFGIFILAILTCLALLVYWVTSKVRRENYAQQHKTVENKFVMPNGSEVLFHLPESDLEGMTQMAQLTASCGYGTIQQSLLRESQEHAQGDPKLMAEMAHAMLEQSRFQHSLIKNVAAAYQAQVKFDVATQHELPESAESLQNAQNREGSVVRFENDKWPRHGEKYLLLGSQGHDGNTSFDVPIKIPITQRETPLFMLHGGTTTGKTLSAANIAAQLRVVFGAELWIADLHGGKEASNGETLIEKLKDLDPYIISKYYGKYVREHALEILKAYFEIMYARQESGQTSPIIYLIIEEFQELARLIPEIKSEIEGLLTQLRKFGMGLILLSSKVNNQIIPVLQGIHVRVAFRTSPNFAEKILAAPERNILRSIESLPRGYAYINAPDYGYMANTPFRAYYGDDGLLSSYIQNSIERGEIIDIAPSKEIVKEQRGDDVLRFLKEMQIMDAQGNISQVMKDRLARHSLQAYSGETWQKYLREFAAGSRAELPERMVDVLHLLEVEYTSRQREANA